MFYLSNHGVPQDLIDKIISETKRFFDQNQTEKEKLLRDPGRISGYIPAGGITGVNI